jgi:hypothetical protein
MKGCTVSLICCAKVLASPPDPAIAILIMLSWVLSAIFKRDQTKTAVAFIQGFNDKAVHPSLKA